MLKGKRGQWLIIQREYDRYKNEESSEKMDVVKDKTISTLKYVTRVKGESKNHLGLDAK